VYIALSVQLIQTHTQTPTLTHTHPHTHTHTHAQTQSECFDKIREKRSFHLSVNLDISHEFKFTEYFCYCQLIFSVAKCRPQIPKKKYVSFVTYHFLLNYIIIIKSKSFVKRDQLNLFLIYNRYVVTYLQKSKRLLSDNHVKNT
jgi:hypothetical protein